MKQAEHTLPYEFKMNFSPYEWFQDLLKLYKEKVVRWVGQSEIGDELEENIIIYMHENALIKPIHFYANLKN